MRKTALLMLLSAWALIASAMEQMDYRDAAEEQRFRALTEELRCVMCQNQSLADSNAMIAHDLRVEILRLMHAGKTDRQIKEYLVERYTDFVLYRPEVKPMTWLLWFGPGLLMVGGMAKIVLIVRKRSRNAPVLPPPDESQEW